MSEYQTDQFQAKVRRWMLRNITIYVDECNEVNATKLAEDCCQEFDLYEYGEFQDANIPEWLFELSAKVSDFYGKV